MSFHALKSMESQRASLLIWSTMLTQLPHVCKGEIAVATVSQTLTRSVTSPGESSVEMGLKACSNSVPLASTIFTLMHCPAGRPSSCCLWGRANLQANQQQLTYQEVRTDSRCQQRIVEILLHATLVATYSKKTSKLTIFTNNGHLHA
jgi:hypothetical protein